MTVDAASRPDRRVPELKSEEPGAATSWHEVPARTALSRLGTGDAGLSTAEAAERLARHGPNCLTPPTPRSALMRFLTQFNNVLIYVLLAAAAISLALGEVVDSAVI